MTRGRRQTTPAATTVSSAPSFETDPVAWFAWVGRLLADAPDAVTEAVRPARWTDHRGHGWWVVVTPEGPQVRPNLESPFLPPTDLPIITAILVTPTALRIELTTRDARHVTRVSTGSLSLVDLGSAMLTVMELPHEGIERFDSREWQRARDRWAGRPATQKEVDGAPD